MALQRFQAMLIVEPLGNVYSNIQVEVNHNVPACMFACLQCLFPTVHVSNASFTLAPTQLTSKMLGNKIDIDRPVRLLSQYFAKKSREFSGSDGRRIRGRYDIRGKYKCPPNNVHFELVCYDHKLQIAELSKCNW